MNEEWKTDGNCSMCRRKGYCSKPCKRNQQRVDTNIRAAMGATLLGTALKQYIQNSREDQ